MKLIDQRRYRILLTGAIWRIHCQSIKQLLAYFSPCKIFITYTH